MKITIEIERGLLMMLQLMARRNYATGWSPAEWDGPTCDCFVQYAAFGKLVYS